jgi:hypothetical protein
MTNQNAAILLPRTIIKNSIGELGILVSLRYDIYGKLYWIVDWAVRGLFDETLDKFQTYKVF